MARYCHAMYLQIEQNTLLSIWFQALHYFLQGMRHFMVIDLFLMFSLTERKKKLEQKIKLREETWCRMVEG